MAELFSRYESGVQFTAGTMTGSVVGVSGLNPLVDRLNSVAPTGSMISGTNVSIYGISTASASAAGVVELATIAETQTGTDTAKAVTPDGLQSIMSPIGAIVAWLKSYTDTPATLPVGWVECDGSILNDAESVYNGNTLPDLNGGEFLRGTSTSGGTGGATSKTLDKSVDTSVTLGATSENFVVKTDAFADQLMVDVGGTGQTSTHSWLGKISDINPLYYNIVWIMRIK